MKRNTEQNLPSLNAIWDEHNRLANTLAEALKTPELMGSLNAVAQSAQPLLADSLKPLSEMLANNAMGLLPSIQLPAFNAIASLSHDALPNLTEASRPLIEAWSDIGRSRSFISCCDRTDWPFYIDADKDDEEALAKLNGEIYDDVELEILVGDFIIRKYANGAMGALEARWSEDAGVDAGKRQLMLESIRRHRAKDYLASTAILSCLFEGLIDEFNEQTQALARVDADVFAYVANSVGVARGGLEGKPKRGYTKDKLVAIVSNVNHGWYYWKASTKYLACIILANSDDGLSERNPLRNKICHGDQTNYGTEVHSLKMILATDLLVQMGGLAKRSAASLEALPEAQEAETVYA